VKHLVQLEHFLVSFSALKALKRALLDRFFTQKKHKNGIFWAKNASKLLKNAAF